MTRQLFYILSISTVINLMLSFPESNLKKITDYIELRVAKSRLTCSSLYLYRYIFTTVSYIIHPVYWTGNGIGREWHPAHSRNNAI